ncbi:MAG: glutathione S-transferase [Pseudomonadota bacterium]
MATKVAAKTAVKAAAKTVVKSPKVVKAVLTISSKNYGAWALRGWLMAKFAGLEFTEKVIPPDDPAMKAEMLLLAPSMLVPSLQHNGIKVWDSLAIGEYLHEVSPKAGLLPADAKARAHCRAICGEMHSGFSAMRGALPMNLKAHHPGFKVWSRAQADIDRVIAIWHECFASYGGPFLFGKQPCIADAMYAPVVTRFLTYDVPLDKACVAYCERMMDLPAMKEWVAAAKKEPDEIDELDAEF